MLRRVEGESLDASAELTTVYQLDPIHVRVEVPQERVVEVEQGGAAEVVIDSFPHDVFRGTVMSISPQVDPDTRVLSVVVEVPNPDQRIKAGMSGFARFREDRTALIVPDSAIVELNGKAICVCGGRWSGKASRGSYGEACRSRSPDRVSQALPQRMK